MKKLKMVLGAFLLVTIAACQDTLMNLAEYNTNTATSDLTAEGDEIPCLDGDGNIIDCPVGTGGGYLLPSGKSFWQCITGTRTASDDGDEVVDACEYEIANMFRPRLNISSREISGCKHCRETYWEVKRHGNKIKIFYALGYYEDYGDPETGLAAHPGDSEFIIVYVEEAAPNSQGWLVDKVYLSAHRGDTGDSSEEVQSGFLRFSGARPIVWVATYKHANYKDKASCNNGGAFALGNPDSCDGSRRYTDVQIYTSRKIADHGTNWVGSSSDRPGVEAILRANRFCGWDRGSGANRSDCASSYKGAWDDEFIPGSS